MTVRERLLLLAFFVTIVATAVHAAPLVGSVGLVTGGGCGLVSAGRLRRLRGRMDATLGSEPARSGFQLRRVLSRVLMHLLVLSLLAVPTLIVPFVGGAMFAGAVAFTTAVPFVLTAGRLRT